MLVHGIVHSCTTHTCARDLQNPAQASRHDAPKRSHDPGVPCPPSSLLALQPRARRPGQPRSSLQTHPAGTIVPSPLDTRTLRCEGKSPGRRLGAQVTDCLTAGPTRGGHRAREDWAASAPPSPPGTLRGSRPVVCASAAHEDRSGSFSRPPPGLPAGPTLPGSPTAQPLLAPCSRSKTPPSL